IPRQHRRSITSSTWPRRFASPRTARGADGTAVISRSRTTSWTFRTSAPNSRSSTMNEQNCRPSGIASTNFHEGWRLRYARLRARQKFFQIEDSCNAAVDYPRRGSAVGDTLAYIRYAFFHNVNDMVDSQRERTALMLAYNQFNIFVRCYPGIFASVGRLIGGEIVANSKNRQYCAIVLNEALPSGRFDAGPRQLLQSRYSRDRQREPFAFAMFKNKQRVRFRDACG